MRCPRLSSSFKQMSVAARMSAAGQFLNALKRLHNGGIVHGEWTPACATNFGYYRGVWGYCGVVLVSRARGGGS